MAGDLKSVFRVTSILTLALAIIFGIHTGAIWVDATLRTGVHPPTAEDNNLLESQIEQLPDGEEVLCAYLGYLPSENYLPKEGNRIGDLWWTAEDGVSQFLSPPLLRFRFRPLRFSTNTSHQTQI